MFSAFRVKITKCSGRSTYSYFTGQFLTDFTNTAVFLLQAINQALRHVIIRADVKTQPYPLRMICTGFFPISPIRFPKIIYSNR
jgi:hypothetical protein